MSGGRLLRFTTREEADAAMDKADDLGLTYSLNKTYIPGGEVIVNQAEIDAWSGLPKKQQAATPKPDPVSRPTEMPVWVMMVTAPTLVEAAQGV